MCTLRMWRVQARASYKGRMENTASFESFHTRWLRSQMGTRFTWRTYTRNHMAENPTEPWSQVRVSSGVPRSEGSSSA
eukprot:7626879-Lingulodinium_polyedra.AAC.1